MVCALRKCSGVSQEGAPTSAGRSRRLDGGLEDEEDWGRGEVQNQAAATA